MAKTDAGAGTAPAPKKAERGTGSTVTLDFHDYPDLLAKMRVHAKADDRELSKWLRRRILTMNDTNSLFVTVQPSLLPKA